MARECDGNYIQLCRKRVKSGCRTCKLRRIKCDEERPMCRRCQSSGRVCGGYGIWGGGGNAYSQQQDNAKDQMTKSERSSAEAQAILTQPVQLMPLERTEWRSFDWYLRRSAVKLPGLFGSDSWTALLFQASTNEPSIRHAVIALASAHQEEVQGASSLPYEGNGEQTLFTVGQYNKAITSLTPCFYDSRITSVRITLVSCALFANMEFLRGHYTKGIVHLEHGLSLLPGILNSVECRDPSSTLVDGWLVTLFTRMLVQAKLFGQTLRISCQNFVDSNLQLKGDTFRSIHHARRCLEQILLRVFDLQEKSRVMTNSRTAAFGTNLTIYQDSIQVELQLWIKTYEQTMSALLPTQSPLEIFAYRALLPTQSPLEIFAYRALLPTQSPLEIFAYRALLLYFRVATILADTCLKDSNELTFDRHLPVFLHIISICIEFHQISFPDGKRNRRAHHDPESTSPNSVSDIGWIGALYLTATKCRNHRVRHQAVKLLQTTLHKEGIWSASLAILVAQQVINIEEGNFYNHTSQNEFNELVLPAEEDLAIPMLPAEYRLSKIDVVLPADRAGKLLLRCCRGKESGMAHWISKEYDLPSKQWNDITWT